MDDYRRDANGGPVHCKDEHQRFVYVEKLRLLGVGLSRITVLVWIGDGRREGMTDD